MPGFTHCARAVATALAMYSSIACGDSSDCELSIATGDKDAASLFQHKTIIKGPLPDLFGETAPKFVDERVLTRDGVLAGNSTAFWLTIALDFVVCALIARAWCGCCRRQAADEYDGPPKSKQASDPLCRTVASVPPPSAAPSPTPPKVVLGSISEVLGLAHAVRAGDAAQCEELLQRDGSLAKREDHCGCSALHVAADCGFASLSRLMVDYGAPINARDSWEETPLHFAARAGSADTCEVLLGCRAELDSRNSDDATPLLLAAQKGNADVCELLLSLGAGVAGLPDEDLPPMLSACLLHRIFTSSVQTPTE